MLAQAQAVYRENRLVRVINCLCPDGRRRVAIVQGDFSTHARVKAFGKTVSGFVTGRKTETGQRDYEFIPYLYRKNHDVFNQELKP